MGILPVTHKSSAALLLGDHRIMGPLGLIFAAVISGLIIWLFALVKTYLDDP